MDRIQLLTRDGSPTIINIRTQQTYHSVHGAIAESKHVFIGEGLNRLLALHEELYILEVGWGTGLNTLLTLLMAESLEKSIHYTAIEPFPLADNEFTELNYCTLLNRDDLHTAFLNMHYCEWETDVSIHKYLVLHKIKTQLQSLNYTHPRHLIYFDAFAPDAQPELWTRQIFEQLYTVLLPGGMLVTYSSKGEVRRNMEAAGFTVIKRPGPIGKREMITAHK